MFTSLQELSAVARGDRTDKDLHRHTSTCLCVAGVPPDSLLPPLLSSLLSSPPSSPLQLLSSALCLRVRREDVQLGAALSVCRLRLNFSAAAVRFLCWRSGFKTPPCVVLSSGPGTALLPPATQPHFGWKFAPVEPVRRPRCARRVGGMRRR